MVFNGTVFKILILLCWEFQLHHVEVCWKHINDDSFHQVAGRTCDLAIKEIVTEQMAVRL